jgi:hypothetical protein
MAEIFNDECFSFKHSTSVGEVQAVLAQIALALSFVPRIDSHLSVAA